MRFLVLKNLKYTIIAVLAIFVLFGSYTVYAAGVDDAISGLNKSGKAAFDGNNSGDGSEGPTSIIDSIPEAIGGVIGGALAFIGVLFLGLMIYGGFTWMNARGNDADTKKAKDIIQAAVIGLIIVLASYAITSYVGDVLFGADTPSVPEA